ncbi:hypothetical protein CPI06_06355, partial [Moraxella catarrhalis]|nr:hypothetical protein [Moraxella catarrhalis]
AHLLETAEAAGAHVAAPVGGLGRAAGGVGHALRAAHAGAGRAAAAAAAGEDGAERGGARQARGAANAADGGDNGRSLHGRSPEKRRHCYGVPNLPQCHRPVMALRHTPRQSLANFDSLPPKARTQST